MSEVVLGVISGVFSALLWGFNPLIIKVITKVESNPIIITALRQFWSGIIAISLAISLSSFAPIELLPLITLSAVLGPIVGDIGLTIAIRELGSGLGTLLSYQYVIVAQLLAVIILSEPYTIGRLLATLSSMTALILVLSGDYLSGRRALGVLGALVACLGWALATIINKIIQTSVDPLSFSITRTVMLLLVFGLPVTIMSKLFRNRENSLLSKNVKVHTLVALSGINGFILAFILFLIALNYVGVHGATILTAGSPVITQLAARTITKESITWRHFLSATLIAIAALLIIVIK